MGTQGVVVSFAATACRLMGEDGLTVLVEGREATLNYVQTSYRYRLTMSDANVIGQRRAAQRLGAAALKSLGESNAEAEVVQEATREALRVLVRELEQQRTSDQS